MDVRTAAFAVACVVLIRPRWSSAVLALAALQVVATFSEFPSDNTNRLVQCFIGVTILLSWRRWPAARALLGLELFVLYGWAFLHKLNWGYFDPSSSCALALARNFPFVEDIPRGLGIMLIATTLATEGALVPLLALPRTRLWGVRLGATFHFVLGLAGFVSFSATMIALLSVFLAPEEIVAARDTLAGWWRRHRTAGIVALAAAVAAFAVVMIADDPSLASWHGVGGTLARWQVRVLFGVWCIGIVPLAALCSPRVGPAAAVPPFAPLAGLRTARPLWILPALMAVNGAAPYLGWKTETAFAMYSNLRTEGNLNNHLFLPTVALGGYQRDLVLVKSSTDPAIDSLARAGLPVPLIEVRRRVVDAAAGGRESVAVSYDVDGVLRVVEHAERDPALSQPLTWLERHWLRFRPINLRGCGH